MTNGSLWTLFFEFLCYLLVGALAVVGVLRKPSTVLALAAAAWLATSVIIAGTPAVVMDRSLAAEHSASGDYVGFLPGQIILGVSSPPPY